MVRPKQQGPAPPDDVMTDWQSQPELDGTTVSTLVAAVGAEAFNAMKQQFIDDLESLATRYLAAEERGDDAEAKACAHALKGAAANIGLQRLSALAASLESGDQAQAEALRPVLSASVDQLRQAA